MRIIGEIPHPQLKITVFSMNNRISLKLEDGMCEQTYKFREGSGVETFQDVQQIVDEGFCQEVLRILRRMQYLQQKSISLFNGPNDLDEFDKII
jgi:hypothetical protein